jgi:hypothetical protein
MCYEYLLNSACPEFDLNGKCSHSHSLFTIHNQKVLEKKLRLSAANDKTFDMIAELIRNSKSKSTEKGLSRFGRSTISDDDREAASTIRPVKLICFFIK